MIPTCATLGQAAGTAAALAVKSKVKLREIGVEMLQGILAEDGVKSDGVPAFLKPSGEASPTPSDVQRSRERLARLDELAVGNKG